MLGLAKASEQYNQYMMGNMADAMAPEPLDPEVDNSFRSGQFNVTIRELIAYYIAMVSLQLCCSASHSIERNYPECMHACHCLSQARVELMQQQP